MCCRTKKQIYRSVTGTLAHPTKHDKLKTNYYTLAFKLLSIVQCEYKLVCWFIALLYLKVKLNEYILRDTKTDVAF